MQDHEPYRRIMGIKAPWYVDSVELKTLGETFLSLDEPGYIVDVYYQVVQTLATTQRSNPRPCWATSLRTSWATCYSAQGIPQGIPPGGVMRANWNLGDLQAIRQGCLLQGTCAPTAP
ncbi:MAG: hypothetical protein ABSG56_08110 [Bryobacteraceae bacterium]|jgi:hypothetical protein